MDPAPATFLGRFDVDDEFAGKGLAGGFSLAL